MTAAQDNTQTHRMLQAMLYSAGHGLAKNGALIRDLVYLVRRSLEDSPPDLNRIHHWLDRMELVAERIMEYPTPFSVDEVSVNSVVSNRISVYRLRAEQASRPSEGVEYSGISFEKDLDMDNCTVKASREWLGRLVDILVENSADAMVQAPVRRVVISTVAEADGVTLTVQDTGKGIDEQALPHLFERPSALDASGRGRGLYIAYLLAEIYGGCIEVAHTGPEGTAIAVWLPSA